MSKIAVIFYGPPGAGKGTQANLLVWRKNFIHFDSGKFLEQLVHDPQNKNNKIIQRERKLFDTGALMTPSVVLKFSSEKAKEVAKAGFNMVFSGAPRTLYEAFGSDANKNNGLMAVLEKYYGKKNIYPFLIDIKPEISIQRNGKRLVCSVCANAILYDNASHKHKTCPLCGAPLRQRILDNPTVFKTRIEEYENRTLPILTQLKKRGYKVIKVDGRPSPFKVHEMVLRKLIV
ncbi:MAG: nucleoside monophosphate kinase [bacterium]|nr:nucleoside monophosphate kinase [bacterium]